MSRLLCVDWDYFFFNPMTAGNTRDETWQLYDWGHAEAVFFIDGPLWVMRARAFEQSGLPLPGMRKPDGDWEAFWARFTFTAPKGAVPDTGAPVAYAADSNAHAGTLAPPDGSTAFESVTLFDAHHDSGYRIASYTDYLHQTSFSCEDWVLEQQRRGTRDLEVRYPDWFPDGPSNDLPEGVLTRQRVDDTAPVETVFDTVFVCRSGAWVPPWCDTEFEAFVDAAPFDIAWLDEEPRNRGWDGAPSATKPATS